MEEIDSYFEQYGSRPYRTDLAIESQQMVGGAESSAFPGVKSFTEETDFATITRSSITTQYAAQALGKSMGNYITIESPDLQLGDREIQKEIGSIVAHELSTLIKMNFPNGEYNNDTFTVLLCGLGNWNATPDAVGPMVVDKAMVTRHVYEMTPPEKRGGLRSVAAISPGVLGLTGVETSEIVSGVVSRIRPNLVIVIDALASRSVSRLGTTIQIGDSGIQPGSGVGNKRAGITRESMGVPVIAIGVPTVVHALTIVADAIEIMEENGHQENAKGAFNIQNQFAQQSMQVTNKDITRSPEVESRIQIAKQILNPHFGTLVVTPKEVDVMVKDLADVIAGGINYALHPAIEENEIYQYLQ